MRHFASDRFWSLYDALPAATRRSADKSFDILKSDPGHSSLRLKRIGRFWSARVGMHYRALAVRDGDDMIWFWIGSHAEYDRLIR